MERTSRQQEILDAAVCVIETFGFSGLTVRRVADEVGVSEPALYRHFSGKLAIIESILDDFQEAVLSRFLALEKMNDAEPLNGFIGDLFDTLGKHETFAPLLFSEEAFHSEPALKNRVYSMMNENGKTLARAIASQQKRGTIRSDIDAEGLSLLVMGCIRVIITRSSLSGGAVRLKDEKDRVAVLLSTVLSV